MAARGNFHRSRKTENKQYFRAECNQCYSVQRNEQRRRREEDAAPTAVVPPVADLARLCGSPAWAIQQAPQQQAPCGGVLPPDPRLLWGLAQQQLDGLAALRDAARARSWQELSRLHAPGGAPDWTRCVAGPMHGPSLGWMPYGMLGAAPLGAPHALWHDCAPLEAAIAAPPRADRGAEAAGALGDDEMRECEICSKSAPLREGYSPHSTSRSGRTTYRRQCKACFVLLKRLYRRGHSWSAARESLKATYDGELEGGFASPPDRSANALQ